MIKAKRLFDQLHVEITECYDVGDRAATVVQLTGRYRGSASEPGRGQPISIEQVHFWHARDGKIIKHRFLENDAEFERQLG